MSGEPRYEDRGDDERAWAELGLREDHENWLADRAAQVEYQDWLDSRQHAKDTTMRTSQMMESKYLKKEDVGEGKLVTVKAIKRENLAKQEDDAEFKFVMFFAELEKGLVLNSTNIQLAEKALGTDETDDWVGKQIVLYEDPNVSYGGKLVGGIRIRAVRRKAAAPAPRTRETLSELEDDVPFK